jgi:hypothetical protein
MYMKLCGLSFSHIWWLIPAGANMKQQKIFLLLQNALLQLQHQILQLAWNALLRDSGFSLFRSAVELDRSNDGDWREYCLQRQSWKWVCCFVRSMDLCFGNCFCFWCLFLCFMSKIRIECIWILDSTNTYEIYQR